MTIRLRFSWRLFWIIFVAATVGILAAVPAGLELFGPVIAKAGPPPIPIPVLVLIGAVQNLVLLGLFVGIGLRLSARIGMGAELTQSWLDGELDSSQVWKSIRFGLLGGLLVGGVLLPLIIGLANYLPNLPFVAAVKIPIWKRLLMCFYGGFYEEIFCRLFLLSLFAWLINRSWRKQAQTLSNAAFWSGNFVAAILFGLGHLPSASLVMPITPLVVVAALILNGIAALVFGWLYRVRGLEAAIIAHFTADILLWVIGPELL
jgi:membrane protease YdiL (CAAX protease family)